MYDPRAMCPEGARPAIRQHPNDRQRAMCPEGARPSPYARTTKGVGDNCKLLSTFTDPFDRSLDH